MNLKNKTILVTGGAGFIGKHTVNYLVQQGADVIILDSLTNSEMPLEFSGIIKKLIIGDIREPRHLDSCFCRKIDYVIHLSALINVAESKEKWQQYLSVNVDGTKLLLEYCKKYKVKRFIYASSASIYGNIKGTVKEKQKKQSQSVYAQTKQIGEDLVLNTEGVEGIVLRYMNVYGKNQNLKSGAVVCNFIDQIKNNDTIKIYGRGSQVRDFVYVKDVARANVEALENGIPSSIYNIGTGKGTRIKRLAKKLCKLLNKNPAFEYLENRSGDIPGFKANVEKTKNELGFLAKYSLDEGLKDMLND